MQLTANEFSPPPKTDYTEGWTPEQRARYLDTAHKLFDVLSASPETQHLGVDELDHLLAQYIDWHFFGNHPLDG